MLRKHFRFDDHTNPATGLAQLFQTDAELMNEIRAAFPRHKLLRNLAQAKFRCVLVDLRCDDPFACPEAHQQPSLRARQN